MAGPPADKLWSIQALRFVAAALVVQVHAAERTLRLTGEAGTFGHAGTIFGRCGVDLFFVISGLIIYRSGKDLRPLDFLAKRVRRVLPLYFVVSSIWIGIALAQGRFGWRNALATFALWPATDVITSPAMPAGWTLCYEALFYGAFALVLWRRWMLAPLLLVFGVGLVTPHGPALPNYIGNPLVLEFLAGVLIARLPRARWALAGIPIGAAILVAGAAFSWPPFGGEREFLSGVDGWVRLLDCGVPAALLVWGALQIEWRPGFLTELGDASYSIYLTHPGIVGGIISLHLLAPRVPADALISAAVGGAVLLGWRAHLLFERPLQRALSRMTRRVRASPSAALVG